MLYQLKPYATFFKRSLLLSLSGFIVTGSLVANPSIEIKANIATMLTEKKDIEPLSDIPGGANNASLKTAAYYAWQEFIALNWPAVKQTGALNDREMADTTKGFGDIAADSNTAYSALVWETFRHKVEIYPGQGQPHGFSNKSGTPNESMDYGYDALPVYKYNSEKAIIDAPAGKTPWVNLDEISQIGTNQIYTGLAPNQQLEKGAGRLILFLAKANRTQYEYIASRGWWSNNQDNPYTPGKYTRAPIPFAGTINRTKDYIQKNSTPPPAQPVIGSLLTPIEQKHDNILVSFPNGTFEVKTAWRLATEDEQKEYQNKKYVTGYHASMIRYYTTVRSSGGINQYKANDALGVMLGLHIIHKTPSAPYFVFASFEHKDNIRRADGTPLEDANGNIVGSVPSAITTSNVTSDPSKPEVVTYHAVPMPLLRQQTFTPDPNTASTYSINNQSYFINTANSGLASDSSSNPRIGVNKRRFDIPSDIVSVNQEVHEMIAAANPSASNPWGNYRLTNVQAKPLTKTAGETFTTQGDLGPATYYMSNSVIETNHVLSKFSGQFFGNVNGSNNTITDFQIPQGEENKGTINVGGMTYHKGLSNGEAFNNVYYDNEGYLMGGCMGCHGNAQVGGSDFSFIFASSVNEPEAAP